MKKQSGIPMGDRLSIRPWWQWIVGIDLFLVLATIAHPHLTPYPGDSLNPLNLASEMNFAAWWSSILLFVLALLAYETYSARSDETQKAWLILAFVWGGLSWDEMGSLHEQLALSFGWTAFIPVGLIGAALVGYAFYQLLKQQQTRNAAILILLGLFTMSTAIIFEYFERLVDWPSWIVGLRVGAEEGIELLGMFLCLWAMVAQRPQQVWPSGWSKVIPNPHRMRYIRTIVVGGWFFHFVVSLFTARYLEIAERGNPAVWYPAVLFLLLAFAALWRFWLHDEANESAAWFQFALFAVATSIATLLLYDIQNKNRLMEALGIFSNFYGQLLLLLVLFTLFALYLFRSLTGKQILLLALQYLLIISGFWNGGQVMQYMSMALLALGVMIVFDLIEVDGWRETNS